MSASMVIGGAEVAAKDHEVRDVAHGHRPRNVDLNRGDLITGTLTQSAIGTLVERSSRCIMLQHLQHLHNAETKPDPQPGCRIATEQIAEYSKQQRGSARYKRMH